MISRARVSYRQSQLILAFFPILFLARFYKGYSETKEGEEVGRQGYLLRLDIRTHAGGRWQTEVGGVCPICANRLAFTVPFLNRDQGGIHISHPWAKMGQNQWPTDTNLTVANPDGYGKTTCSSP